MKNCKSCKHLKYDGYVALFAVVDFHYCALNRTIVKHPCFMGKKCECYESRKVAKKEFVYPKKEVFKGDDETTC